MPRTNKSKESKGKEKLKIYKRPMSLSPWSKGEESSNGSVWISMKPKKILDQYSKGGGDFITSDPIAEFIFLAPLSLNENIMHQWSAYESVASRLAQKARSLVKLANEGRAMWDQGKQYLTQEAADKEAKDSGQALRVEDWVKRTYNNVPGARIPKIKIDTPLYYENSERRTLELTFELFNETHHKDKNPEKHLLEPIHELMKYSSPDLVTQGGIDIQFPYMWEVRTKPIEFIKYPTCVLTGVQPTWNSPYVNGYPISCNLQLTFKDLSPLYAGTIESGTVINVKTGNIKSTIKKNKNKDEKKKKKAPTMIKIDNKANVFEEPLGMA